MGKVIVIASGKGGTGKTTTAAALASALADKGERILCIDADVGLKNLDLSLGLSEMALMDFTDVLDGRATLEEAATPHPLIKSLHFLSAPSLKLASEIDSEKMKKMLLEVRDKYDFCFVDAPAGIDSGFKLASENADAAIVVTTNDASSCRDVQRVVMELRELGISDISLIVNRIRPRLFKRMGQNVDDIIDSVGARLIGLVPEDRSVIISATRGLLLTRCGFGGASAAFKRTAERILGERIPAGDIKPII